MLCPQSIEGQHTLSLGFDTVSLDFQKGNQMWGVISLAFIKQGGMVMSVLVLSSCKHDLIDPVTEYCIVLAVNIPLDVATVPCIKHPLLTH